MAEHEKKLMNINTKGIEVDKNGQRDVELRKSEFNRMMKEFDPDLLDPISVAFVEGKYYCYDGQMRMKVVKAKHGGKDTTMKCMVIYGLTLPEVAELFLKRNDPHNSVSTKLSDRIRVAANYGSQDELNFLRYVEKNNFRIDKWNDSVENGVLIQATQTLWDEYHRFDNNGDFDTFLYILYHAFAEQKMGTNGKIIRGLGLVVRTYTGSFKAQDMASSLRKLSPVDIITSAEGGKKTRQYSTADYSWQMVHHFNKGRTVTKLDESLLRGAK